MRYLIIGGSGLLGILLAKKLSQYNEVAVTYYTNPIMIENCTSYKINLITTTDLEGLIGKFEPEVVIHAAPTSNVDWCEAHRDEAYQVNVTATKTIAEKCNAIGAKIVYVSTSFVFPNSQHIFTENDVPAPINFYGVTKLGGELATSTNPNHIIVRTDQIFGWTSGKKKSFVENVLTNLNSGNKIEVCQDWYNSPTYVEDLSNAIQNLISRDKRGHYHVTGDEHLNRVEWATMIARIFEKDPSLIHPIHSSTLNLPAKRPNARLSNTKIKKEIAVEFGTLEDKMRAMRDIAT